jgi:NSS family neurotransmitter:Na+ symporter
MKTAMSVAVIDTLVAILSGFIIFPAVFSVSGLSIDAGPGLVFITLPNVFQMAFSNMPFIGYIFAVMFYVLLVLAALTSTISLHEVATVYINERFRVERRRAAFIVTGGVIVMGILCALSFGLLNNIRLFGLTFFDFFDFLTAKIMMPLGGLLIAVFSGWYLDKKIVYNQVNNWGTLRFPLFRFYIFLLRFVAPIGIAFIFVNELFS